ncbi:MAG: hypothetical protein ACYDA1_09735 [Vulcanimicrobiaceae bacterium]
MIELEELNPDAIAMELTVAAIEAWLNRSTEDRDGEAIGREIGAMYREIHTAVAEMHIEEEDEDGDFDEEEEQETEVVPELHLEDPHN